MRILALVLLTLNALYLIYNLLLPAQIISPLPVLTAKDHSQDGFSQVLTVSPAEPSKEK